jgi:hypothetical protein
MGGQHDSDLSSRWSKGGGVLTRGPHQSTGRWGVKLIKLVQIISNGFEFNSKLVQILFDLDMTFPNSKNLKTNMVLKGSKRGITFSIEASLDLKWILNENLEKLVGLKFNRIW